MKEMQLTQKKRQRSDLMTAAAVAAAVKNTKTRRTAVGGMPAAVLFLGFRREGNSFDKSTLLTYTEKHA